MHDSPLMELMEHVLEAHGFSCTRNAALEGRSGTVYTVPLLAEDEEHHVIVDAQLEDDPLPMAAVADMCEVLEDVGANIAVLCHTGRVEPGTEQEQILLWDPETMRAVIGDTLLAQATGQAPAPLPLQRSPMPVAESISDIMPAAFQDEPAEVDLAALEQLEGAPFALDVDALAMADTASTAVDDGPRHDAADPGTTFGYPLLPVRITPDEARIQLKDRLGQVHDVQMVLQPVHLYDYECDLLAEGSLRYDTVSGRVQVHGTDKVVIEVDPEAVDPEGYTRLSELPAIPGQERTLRATPERAKQRCTDFLMTAHSRMVDVEVEDDDNGYSYTEKRKVEPRPDHVRLHHVGTFHRVVWRFIGSGGQVDVDALDCTIIEEVLNRPDPDVMIID